MNMNLTAQQTALLDLLHLNAIDSIAISTSIKPETGLFPALNPDATLRGLRAYRANARALVTTLHSSQETYHSMLHNIWNRVMLMSMIVT